MFKKRPMSARGQGMLDYALILVMILVVIIVAYAIIGNNAKKTGADIFTDQYIKRIFATTKGINPQDVTIKYRVNDGVKNYVFRLETTEGSAVMWCEVLSETEGSCRPFEAATGH